MKKMLRTIRFDETDARVFAVAAAAGEWAVPGGFDFAGLTPADLTGKTKQAFANGFLGLASFGRSTFVTVGEITDAELAGLTDTFARRLVADYGAPDDETARRAAADEVAFAGELCAEVPINTVFTVRRSLGETGDIREEFRTITPPSGEVSHARVWSIVDEAE